jgi:hypothetical protein
MTIDERAEEIKREVDKEVEIENDTGWIPPPPLVRYSDENTETKPMPLYLSTMFYEKTENHQKHHLPHMVNLPSVPTPPPYYLHPNISHVFGQPTPHLDFSKWFLEDTNLRAIIKVRLRMRIRAYICSLNPSLPDLTNPISTARRTLRSPQNNSSYKTLIINDSEHFYDNRLRIFGSTSVSLQKLSIAANPKLTPYGIKSFFNNSEARLMEVRTHRKLSPLNWTNH